MKDKKSLVLIMSSIVLFLPILSAQSLYAKVFKRPERALKDAFPDCSIETMNIILNIDQVKRVEELSGISLKTRLVTFYVAKREGKVIGYAFIDTHILRTQLETVMYTITPDGELDIIELLSFNEPLEYMPEDGWLLLFKKKSLKKDPVKLRMDIPNVTGATLTAKAITDNARKVLSLWNVIFGGK